MSQGESKSVRKANRALWSKLTLGLAFALALTLVGPNQTPATATPALCTAVTPGTGSADYDYAAGNALAGSPRTIVLDDLGCGTFDLTVAPGTVLKEYALGSITGGTATLVDAATQLAGGLTTSPTITVTPDALTLGAWIVPITVTEISTTASVTVDLIFNVQSAAPAGNNRPTCTNFTLATTKNEAITVNLAELIQLGYCADNGLSALDTVDNLNLAMAGKLWLVPVITPVTNNDPLTASPMNGKVSYARDAITNLPNRNGIVFKPDTNYLTPSDQVLDRAQFKFKIVDEFGSAVTSGVETIYTLIINVNVEVTRSGCSTYEAPSGPIFNDPTVTSSRDKQLTNSRFAITNNIIKMIDCAAPGSVIAMSWFSMTDDNMANHITQAVRHGVHVRMLINSHSAGTQTWVSLNRNTAFKGKKPSSTNNNAKAADSGSASVAGSWLTTCELGCLTPRAPAGLEFPAESEAEYPALHAKFFLFSKTGKSKFVTGIASSNPTYEQAKRGFNNAYIYVGSAKKRKLYDSLSTYFGDLTKAACTDHRYSACDYPAGWRAVAPKVARVLKSNSTTTSYYAFPKAVGTSDDITDILTNVTCKYLDPITGKQMRTKIYVNMFVFTRNSPAMKLWRLANGYGKDGRVGGCEIVILYTDMDQRIKGYNGTSFEYLLAPNGKKSNYGAADCLSTTPLKNTKTLSANSMYGLQKELVWDSEAGKYVRRQVCNNGTLNGLMPTINKSGGEYCWHNTKSKLTGGKLKICVSTPLRVNANDTADARAKLEPAYDSAGKKWYTHQKYILIDGMVNGLIGQTVISGNTNLSQPALRWNDEIMTITTSKTAFKSYLANFNSTLTKVQNRAKGNACVGVTDAWTKETCSVVYRGTW